MLRNIMITLAITLLSGCTTLQEIKPVTYENIRNNTKIGAKVAIYNKNELGKKHIVSISEINENAIVGVDKTSYPYESIGMIGVEKFDPKKPLVYPLMAIYYPVSFIYGAVVLMGSVICIVIFNSQKCGALLTS